MGALDLAARHSIKEMEKDNTPDLNEYANPCSEKHCRMVDKICRKLKLTSLKYQKLDNLITSIGLPKEKLCTYCWDGKE